MMINILALGSITIIILLLWIVMIRVTYRSIERMVKDILIKRRIHDYFIFFGS